MNLVIQGNQIKIKDAEQLLGLSGASGIENINSHAFRLRGAIRPDGVREYCMNAGLDYAFVPETQTLKQVGLVVMDMDSTLIAIECIDEIADMLGLKPQVAAITAAAMRGEIEFAESLIRRTALLQGLDQGALQRVYDERLKLSPGAERMLETLKQHNVRTLLVSGGFTFFTERLKQRLGLDYTAGNTLEIVGGKLTGKVLGKIVDAQGKADSLDRVRNELGLGRDAVVAIGDGANDLKMMERAGISIAYRAKPVVQQKATYALNHVGLDGVLNLFAGA